MAAQKFSEELIKRGQKYFEKNCGIKVSKEEMDLWLDSLADFCGFFERRVEIKNSMEKK